VFNKNNLVGYRLWKIEKGKFTPFYVGKVDVCNIFKKYNVLNCKLTTQNSITSSIRVPIIHYPKYNIEGRLLKNSRFTDSEIIAITYDCPVTL